MIGNKEKESTIIDPESYKKKDVSLREMREVTRY